MDKPRAKLPDSWSTNQDGHDVARKMFRLLGPHAACLMVDTVLPGGASVQRWYLVRYLDRVPKNFSGNPARRDLEVLAQGATLHEIQWHLDRALSGARPLSIAYTPVRDRVRGWVGFTSPAGLDVGSVLPSDDIDA